MTKRTEAMWVERVREWRASGLSAELFAEGKGYEGSSLRWADSRLRGTAADEVPRPRGRPRKTPSVAPALVSTSSSAPHFVPLRARPSSRDGVVVEVGAACIRVTAGFDGALLRDVVRALGEGAR